MAPQQGKVLNVSIRFPPRWQQPTFEASTRTWTVASPDFGELDSDFDLQRDRFARTPDTGPAYRAYARYLAWKSDLHEFAARVNALGHRVVLIRETATSDTRPKPVSTE